MLQTMMTIGHRGPPYRTSDDAVPMAADVHPRGARKETSRSWCPCRLRTKLRRTFPWGNRITFV